MSSKKALIAMSGGVDSSVAARRMQLEGYECTGITMKLFNNEDIGICEESTCCSLEDVEFARNVCGKLGMPFYVFDLSGDFNACVIDRFIEAYRNGETPNPCIDCNRFLKFGKLLERAEMLDFDVLATGHYARVEKSEETGRYVLRKAVDLTKDQSYVLYGCTQEQLAKLQFPLGETTKTEVRKFAASEGFSNANKPDSQDICFVPDGDYAAFIEQYDQVATAPGKIIDTEGNLCGEHSGLIRYTLGQRKGLGLGTHLMRYVVGKDVASNVLIVGEKSDLYSTTFSVRDVNWVALAELEKPMIFTVKTGYRHPGALATVTQTAETEVQVAFVEPQRAITPGQAAVIYDSDIVVAGGTIHL